MPEERPHCYDCEHVDVCKILEAIRKLERGSPRYNLFKLDSRNYLAEMCEHFVGGRIE